MSLETLLTLVAALAVGIFYQLQKQKVAQLTLDKLKLENEKELSPIIIKRKELSETVEELDKKRIEDEKAYRDLLNKFTDK